ncbi:MAG: hypothetical protein K2N05_10630 [Muribaculaceae bacterium]|nr:hypothetical protein [Muribaculaceae bacterium]
MKIFKTSNYKPCILAGSAVLLFLNAIPALGQTFDDHINAARSSYEAYDFAEATRLLGLARNKMTASSEIEKDMANSLQKQIDLAKRYITRVEHLQILDSISVGKEDFFKYYKLPASAGYLDGTDALPYEVQDVEYVFTNENDDFKMWAQPDSTGFYNIAESLLLTDGTWSSPAMAPLNLGGGKNAEFPFMMSDGVTLYYASDGDASIGGYDIFVATRDAQTGEYLQPQNLGMPYNSPFDDYLLAIDEENGVGWWVTDRNQEEDYLTLYLFKLNDTRRNYDSEEEETDIRDLALIKDFKATQDPDTDYSEILEAIRTIPVEKRKHADFHFPRKGGNEYTTLDDFQTTEGRRAMKRYLQSKEVLDLRLNELSELRRQYAGNPSSELKQRIRELEQSTEKGREDVKKMRNEVYHAEGN